LIRNKITRKKRVESLSRGGGARRTAWRKRWGFVSQAERVDGKKEPKGVDASPGTEGERFKGGWPLFVGGGKGLNTNPN